MYHFTNAITLCLMMIEDRNISHIIDNFITNNFSSYNFFYRSLSFWEKRKIVFETTNFSTFPMLNLQLNWKTSYFSLSMFAFLARYWHALYWWVYLPIEGDWTSTNKSKLPKQIRRMGSIWPKGGPAPSQSPWLRAWRYFNMVLRVSGYFVDYKIGIWLSAKWKDFPL